MYKFDFGSGPVESSYTPVLPGTAYNASRGYGFASTTGLTASDRGAPDTLRRDFITSSSRFTFNVDVPNGNYNVTVTMGDHIATSATTIKAGYGRIVVDKLTTAAGQFARRTFTVNVRDGQLTLEFSWTAPKINAVQIEEANAVTLFLAGDSTVCDQFPMSDPYIGYGGWGQMLTLYFNPGVAIANYANSGESTVSFWNEFYLGMRDHIKANDYVFVQFGHNDEKSVDIPTYRQYLKMYIDDVRQRKAIPVLITSVARRKFDDNGKLVDTHNDYPAVMGLAFTDPNGNPVDTHGDYPAAMRQVAVEQNVALIDLTARSMAYFQSLGIEGTKSVFFFLDPQVSPDYPDGVEDNSHFSVSGAIQVARLVVEEIREKNIQPLASYLK